MPRVLAALVAVLLIPSAAPSHAKVIFARNPGSDAQGFVQSPPRDAPPKTGRATLRGHVVAADNGRPLRRAQVRLTSQELRENRLATTDADGGYTIKDLPAGRYILTASKGGYIQLSYGQQRPFEAGKPVNLLDGQTIEKVDFALPLGGVITGRILDEFGDPITDAQVMPMRSQFAGGRRQLVPVGRPSMTNDIGEFRLFALSPGQYYITATLRTLGGAPASTDDRNGYAPTYYPGTANQAEAQRITVGLGQTITDLNMILVPTRTARVSGTAVDSTGKPSAGSAVMLAQRSGQGMMVSPGAQVRPDGSFELSGLAPGEYTLQLGGSFPPVPDAESASVTITVSGSDITDVRLVGARPSTITGRLIVNPTAARSLPLATLRIFAQSREPDFGPPLGGSAAGQVRDDLTFELKSRPGEWRMTTTGAPGWAIKSVRYAGADVTDSGITVRPNDDLSGLEVELTNRLTDLSGTVTAARGGLLKDYTVVVFARESDRWSIPRYQRVARPDQDGHFKITGLPAGRYYAVALDYIEPGEATDPEFLERVAPGADGFSLQEGETKTVDLRLKAK